MRGGAFLPSRSPFSQCLYPETAQSRGESELFKERGTPLPSSCPLGPLTPGTMGKGVSILGQESQAAVTQSWYPPKRKSRAPGWAGGGGASRGLDQVAPKPPLFFGSPLRILPAASKPLCPLVQSEVTNSTGRKVWLTLSDRARVAEMPAGSMSDTGCWTLRPEPASASPAQRGLSLPGSAAEALLARGCLHPEPELQQLGW